MLMITLADLNKTEHAQAYIYLMKHYSREPISGGKHLSTFSQNNLIDCLIKRDDVVILLAFKDGKPAGFLTAFEGFSTFACKPLFNIHDVSVHRDFRGLGISKLLFAEIEKLARLRDYCKITLEVISENKIARNAYQQQGYHDPQIDPKQGNTLFWNKPLNA
ncbi:N-acetyltransferase GCN5 [Psychromonas sp. CNPT3]|uniref:GNAT family N-acetyltransferase n=1 Tax=Psychromonas sp. CNPT3 TaxID=314282 RepID=UPI00006E706C|nr:GNAT family N-acetyltransferase [Psychromonas sp. CNPT3]AGH80134.1 N-acetyltransferase GCN5 [Psychromonas sp. CNPT3]